MKSNSWYREWSGLAQCREERWVRRFVQLTRNAAPLFVRGGDILSIRPQVLGRHELDVEQALAWAAEDGHGDFLIDIGANIGLTSCFAGGAFARVYCFEPNPLAFKILEVNTAVSLGRDKTRLFNEGIGEQEGRFLLYMPPNNWGGAFILEGNGYDRETLARKDELPTFDERNYIPLEVSVSHGKTRFAEIFTELSEQGLKRGSIKIDAEGFEPIILRAIADSLPDNFSVWIIFENHEKGKLIETLTSLFNRPLSLSSLRMKRLRGASVIRWIKALFGQKCSLRMLPCEQKFMPRGNLVLRIATKGDH